MKKLAAMGIVTVGCIGFSMITQAGSCSFALAGGECSLSPGSGQHEFTVGGTQHTLAVTTDSMTVDGQRFPLSNSKGEEVVRLRGGDEGLYGVTWENGRLELRRLPSGQQIFLPLVGVGLPPPPIIWPHDGWPAGEAFGRGCPPGGNCANFPAIEHGNGGPISSSSESSS